ncbi:MAG: hypothetical protein ACLFWG_04645 [Longimicrobiales bacterium]
MSTELIPSSKDRSVPTTYQGKLPPNYYCRSWNAKREKYCKARSGAGTDHVGQGRCKHHGGDSPIKSGRYSTVEREDLAEAMEAFLADPDPLNLLDEVAMLKALIRGELNRHEELVEALLAWNRVELLEATAEERRPRFVDIPKLSDVRDVITDLSLVVSRIQKAQSDQAISRKDFFRVISEIARAVEMRVQDPDLLKQLRDDILSIRLA